MAQLSRRKKRDAKAMMLGVGLDSDGHKRISRGENFTLIGGTKDTHEAMIEKSIKINEKLADRGKALEEVTHEEFSEIAHSVGLQRHEPEED